MLLERWRVCRLSISIFNPHLCTIGCSMPTQICSRIRSAANTHLSNLCVIYTHAAWTYRSERHALLIVKNDACPWGG